MEVIYEDKNEYGEGFSIEKRGEELFVICEWDSGVCRGELNLTEVLKKIDDGK